MGSLISLITDPFTILVNKIINLNDSINGNWFVYIKLLSLLLWRRFSSKSRLKFHDKSVDHNCRAVGLLPIDDEWHFDAPNRTKCEDIYIYGVNSEGQYLTLRIKWRPIDTNGSVVTKVDFTLKLDNESVYRLEEENTSLNNFAQKLVEYRIAGLGFEVLSPFRRSRLKFRGYLKKINSNELIYARIRLLWLSVSNVFDFKADQNDYFLAKELSRINYNEIPDLEDRFEQFGQLKGTVQFENEPQKGIFLWGNKSKRYLPNINENKMSFIRIYGYTKRGIGFHVGFVNVNNNNKIQYFRYGYVFWKLGFVHAVKDISLSVNDFNDLKTKSSFSFTIKALHRQIYIEVDSYCDKNMRKMKANGSDGFCFIESEEQNEFNKQLLFEQSLKYNECKCLVLSLEEEEAQRVDLSGGKGSSLAKLIALSSEITDKFSVPKGLIVTTNAYNLLLEDLKIKSEIESLQRLVWTKNRNNIMNECKRVSELIANCELPKDVREQIDTNLKANFGDNYNEKLFAVRSSASGEDSEEMSAAGQMTSYLGIKGGEDIYKSVMKCWSSQFELVSIEYKRGYGQLINSPMAVVIQEMVNCDSAGVVFTCDPITGDERDIIITANYGLGESVVSSRAEPDTVRLKVKVEDNCLKRQRNLLKIDSKNIGSKKKIIKLCESGGTAEEEFSDEQTNQCCIEDKDILNLGYVALQVHSYYGNPRDIEWGLKNGSIYLLQSRPVTNLDNSFTEYELMHELDTGHQSQVEINSRSHWGENFPGSQSWLLLSFAMKTWDIMISRRPLLPMFGIEFNPYVTTLGGFFYNQYFLSLRTGVFDILSSGDKKNNISRGFLIGFFGHDITDEEVLSLAEEKLDFKPPTPLIYKIRMFFGFLVKILFCGYRLRKTRTKYFQEFDLIRDKDFENAQQLFEHICNNYDNYFISKEVHGGCSIRAVLSSALMLALISKDSENESEADSDLALLLSTCNEVVSAEVPNDLREIAKAIENPEKFILLSDEEAIELLNSGINRASDKFKNFISKHGHRGYREFEYMYKPWGDSPSPIIKTIKMMLSSGTNTLKTKPEKSVDDLLKSIKTKLSAKYRFLLRYILLPYCRTSVGLREQSKYFMVWMYNKYRKAFQLLATKMVAEGRIPDEETIFFLTIDEIERLFKDRDPILLAKARQRRRIHPKMDKYKFDEFVKGPLVRPRNIDNHLIEINTNETIKMIGTVASSGKTIGRACVIEDISEAHTIQSGDILITYSTDIGWSPYFPIINGIVTEIGGTVSHGAVIAREYGIPCLIAVDGACRTFTTGDNVLLDAELGQISKIS